MINQFVLISPRGDTLVSKTYRGTFTAGQTTDVFLRKVQDNTSAPPIFLDDGVIFASIKLNNMYFVFTTQDNASPHLMLELLSRLARVFKDYCGVLTEESIRKNFLLLYELLDEVIDHGYPQGMSTELLKAYVYNEPMLVEDNSTILSSKNFLVPAMLQDRKTMPSAQANKPINIGESTKSKENVVFVDLIEKITMILDRTCSTLHSSINGAIVLKSYLVGSPEMRLGLNEDLVVRSLGIRGFAGGVSGPCLPLEDANFHECVRWNEESGDPSFTFFAPDGEFTLMNYRINTSFRAPILCVPLLEEQGASGLDLVLRVRGEFPAEKNASNVTVNFVIPSFAASVSLETAVALGGTGQGGKAEYDRAKRVVKWVIPGKFAGNAEFLIRAKMMLHPNVRASTIDLKQFGVINMSFEIPMYLCSNMTIRYLDFLYNSGSNQPHKWIRYLTNVCNYAIRL